MQRSQEGRLIGMAAKHGKLAYEAYSESRGGMSATGAQLASWENINEQEHWEAAAAAVAEKTSPKAEKPEKADS